MGSLFYHSETVGLQWGLTHCLAHTKSIMAKVPAILVMKGDSPNLQGVPVCVCDTGGPCL
jgi:hypothetical protein